MKKILSVCVVLCLLGIVGSMDYEDEVDVVQHYCQMVKDGHWPNYENRECSDV